MKPWVGWMLGVGWLALLGIAAAVYLSVKPSNLQKASEVSEDLQDIKATFAAYDSTGADQSHMLLDHSPAVKTSPWLRSSKQPQSPYLFLIPFVMQDGIPLVSVRIMSQKSMFVCVADTGSMHLNVGASTCAKCTQQYGSFVPTEALQNAPEEPLHYGTQHDVVKQVADSIQLHTNGRTYSTPVHVAVRREMAVSNYNVFGMLRDDTEGISYAILKQNSSLLVRFAEPAGRIGGIDAVSATKFEQRSSVVARLIKSSAMGFYMVRLTGLWAGDDKIETTTQLVIVDTGSNMTSFPKSTMRQLRPKLKHMQALTLELDGQAMRIQPKHLFWRNTSHLMLDDDLTVLGRNAQDYMILGCYCMQGHQLLFKHDKLCIAPSHLGAIELM